MPKIKTKSSAKKRFSVTKSGKFKYQKAGRRHRLISETPKTNRQLRKSAYVHDSDWQRVAQMLPYK